MVLRDQAIKKTTLCFVIDRARGKNGSLLMIEKKRGQGAGKWNMPGGKFAPGESASEAAVRETIEETGIEPLNVREVGLLEFYFPESNSWNNICSVFVSEEFRGELIPDSDECRAHWVSLDAIPYDKMWDDDRLWVPFVFAGKYFHRVYTFDQNDHMKSEKVIK